MSEKTIVLDRLRPLLRPGGLLFGTAILGAGVSHTAWSRMWLSFLNERGVFGNTDNYLQELDMALQRNFSSYELEVRGRVGIFVGDV
jgi:hypothetical protein